MRPDVDPDTAVELLYGPIYTRVLLHTRPLSADEVTTVLELVLLELSRNSSRAASWRRRYSMLSALAVRR